MSDAARLMRHIDVVLVQPGRPGNIGATARAMKNLGSTRLIMVRPCHHLAKEALQMAYGAHEILTQARIVQSLSEAVEPYRLVIGTTTRAHTGYGPPDPIAAHRRSILAHARRWRVAMVFGSEQNGLNNEEIALCQHLVCLPMVTPSPSYNLAQAVMLVLYDLFGGAFGRPAAVAHDPAPSRELERMYADWKGLLAEIGFLKGRQGQHILADLRRIFGRAKLDSREVRIIRGMMRQTTWHHHRDDRRSAHHSPMHSPAKRAALVNKNNRGKGTD